MSIPVLWIEDNALDEVARYSGPVNTSGEFDMDVALDTSYGIRKILQSTYDAVIVDIRLPPGHDEGWRNLYRKSRSNKALARLGLHLLEALLDRPKAVIDIGEIPAWIEPRRFGVLTVETESEIGSDLTRLGIKVLQTKRAGQPATVLLDVIRKVLSGDALNPHD